MTDSEDLSDTLSQGEWCEWECPTCAAGWHSHIHEICAPCDRILRRLQHEALFPPILAAKRRRTAFEQGVVELVRALEMDENLEDQGPVENPQYTDGLPAPVRSTEAIPNPGPSKPLYDSEFTE